MNEGSCGECLERIKRVHPRHGGRVCLRDGLGRVNVDGCGGIGRLRRAHWIGSQRVGALLDELVRRHRWEWVRTRKGIDELSLIGMDQMSSLAWMVSHMKTVYCAGVVTHRTTGPSAVKWSCQRASLTGRMQWQRTVSFRRMRS